MLTPLRLALSADVNEGEKMNVVSGLFTCDRFLTEWTGPLEVSCEGFSSDKIENEAADDRGCIPTILRALLGYFQNFPNMRPGRTQSLSGLRPHTFEWKILQSGGYHTILTILVAFFQRVWRLGCRCLPSNQTEWGSARRMF